MLIVSLKTFSMFMFVYDFAFRVEREKHKHHSFLVLLLHKFCGFLETGGIL